MTCFLSFYWFLMHKGTLPHIPWLPNFFRKPCIWTSCRGTISEDFWKSKRTMSTQITPFHGFTDTLKEFQKVDKAGRTLYRNHGQLISPSTLESLVQHPVQLKQSDCNSHFSESIWDGVGKEFRMLQHRQVWPHNVHLRFFIDCRLAWHWIEHNIAFHDS